MGSPRGGSRAENGSAVQAAFGPAPLELCDDSRREKRMNHRSSRIFLVAGMLALAVPALAQTATPAAPAPPAFRLVAIGPPAPVPPEVAMLRPVADELQQMNAALRRFIDSDTSDARALLKKYESLILVPPPRLNVAATFTQTPQRMGPRHQGFVETAKAANIDLL